MSRPATLVERCLRGSPCQLWLEITRKGLLEGDLRYQLKLKQRSCRAANASVQKLRLEYLHVPYRAYLIERFTYAKTLSG